MIPTASPPSASRSKKLVGSSVRRSQRRETTRKKGGRRTKNEKLRFAPHGGGDDDLDLLSSRETSSDDNESVAVSNAEETQDSPLQFVVLGDVSVESNILQMLSYELTAHLSRSRSFSRSLKVVELLDEFRESEIEKSLSSEEDVVLYEIGQEESTKEEGGGDVPCGPYLAI